MEVERHVVRRLREGLFPLPRGMAYTAALPAPVLVERLVGRAVFQLVEEDYKD